MRFDNDRLSHWLAVAVFTRVIIFLIWGFLVFHLWLKAPTATIAPFTGTCCAVQLTALRLYTGIDSVVTLRELEDCDAETLDPVVICCGWVTFILAQVVTSSGPAQPHSLPLELVLKADRNTYRMSDSLHLETRITNVGEEEIYIRESDLSWNPARGLSMRIIGADGKYVQAGFFWIVYRRLRLQEKLISSDGTTYHHCKPCQPHARLPEKPVPVPTWAFTALL